MCIRGMAASGLLCLVAGCSGTGATYQPIADQPITRAYQSDLEACQQLARSKSLMGGQTQTAMLLTGLTLGLAAAFDDEADGERLESGIGGALVGAALGGAGGAFETNDGRSDVVIDCMKGRGHQIVG